jgi:hypothetical protein
MGRIDNSPLPGCNGFCEGGVGVLEPVEDAMAEIQYNPFLAQFLSYFSIPL